MQACAHARTRSLALTAGKSREIPSLARSVTAGNPNDHANHETWESCARELPPPPPLSIAKPPLARLDRPPSHTLCKGEFDATHLASSACVAGKKCGGVINSRGDTRSSTPVYLSSPHVKTDTKLTHGVQAGEGH
uniref:Uncharacterized protein n=1 Tax=Mesocestoides corti TaxID=53468 RepID=A0A5K3G360_MESCO